MPVDLEVQIREYAQFLRTEAAIDLSTVIEEAERTAPTATPPPRQLRPTVVVLGAAALVLVIVGGIALLWRLAADEPPVVEEPTPTTVVNELESVGGTPVPIDTDGNVGSYPAIVVGADGIPIIAYVDESNLVVKLARCAEGGCSEAAIVELGPWGGAVSHAPAIAIGSDGIPLVAFGSESELLVYKCADESCSGGTLTPAGGGVYGAQGVLVAMAADGLPLLAFTSDTADLAVLKCGRADCSGGNVSSTLIPREDGLALTADWVASTVEGMPVIGYRYADLAVGVVLCHDPACSSSEELEDGTGLDLDPHTIVGSIVATGGGPLRTGFEEDEAGGGSIVVTACDDVTCSSGTSAVLAEYEGDHVFVDPIVLPGPGGLPLIFFTDGNELKRAMCSDPTCTGPIAVDVVVRTGGSHLGAAVAVGADGNPVIALSANSDLSFLACGEADCSDVVVSADAGKTPSESSGLWVTATLSTGAVYTADFNPPHMIDAQGRLVAAYIERTGPSLEALESGEASEEEATPPVIRLIRCDDLACRSRSTTTVDVEAYGFDLAAGPGSRPTIAYQDYTAALGVAVTRCADTECATFATDQLAFTGSWPSVGIAPTPDGGTIVSYQDWNDFYPRLVRCDPGGCRTDDTATPIRLFETPDELRFIMNSFAARVAADGLPNLFVVQGSEAGTMEAWFADCLDPACVDGEVVMLADGLLDTATGTLEMGSDGLPLVAYYADGNLEVVKCHDASCTQRTTTNLGPAIADFIAGVAPSVAFGPDGRPVVAYWNSQGHVVLAVCQDEACSRSSIVDFGDVGSHSLGFASDELPFLLYNSDGLQYAKCIDPACLGP